MSDIPVCIDISHHQGYPDFDEVKAAGVLGVIHKATEGTTFIDDARAENLANAQKAGLAIATYFWLKPGDGASQAEFYLQTIDPVQGERVVIDYEEDGCSLTTLKDAVQALLDYRYDLQITVYSGHLLKEQLGDRADAYLAANTDLWLAQYADESSISWPEGTYPAWSLWQYSETGEIPGINDSYVDLDEFCDDNAAFLQWINPKGSAPRPPPVPTPDSEMVDVAITAPDNITVRVSINGVIARRHWIRQRAKRGPDILR
jgi:lysozyme